MLKARRLRQQQLERAADAQQRRAVGGSVVAGVIDAKKQQVAEARHQFVELACKNDDARAIRKGVEWAAYIGVQLRWLRDKEASPENIEFMRHMMKTANYAHQL